MRMACLCFITKPVIWQLVECGGHANMPITSLLREVLAGWLQVLSSEPTTVFPPGPCFLWAAPSQWLTVAQIKTSIPARWVTLAQGLPIGLAEPLQNCSAVCDSSHPALLSSLHPSRRPHLHCHPKILATPPALSLADVSLSKSLVHLICFSQVLN